MGFSFFLFQDQLPEKLTSIGNNTLMLKSIFGKKTEKMDKSLKPEFLHYVIQSPNNHFSEIPHFIDRNHQKTLWDKFFTPDYFIWQWQLM
jgi:hypothetical protein